MNENLRQAIGALYRSVASIIADDELVDKQAAVEETFQQYHEHVFEKVLKADEADDDADADDADEAMDKTDDTKRRQRRQREEEPMATKREIYNAINSRAQEARDPDESEAQAFAKFLDTAEGKEAYARYKRAPADEQATVAKTVTPAPIPTPTPSYRKLMAKADELREVEPKLTEAQAFSKVFCDPRFAELAKAARAEERERGTTVAKSDNASAGDRLARCAAALARQHPDLTHAEAFKHAKERNPDLAAAYERETRAA
jgi:hypothetical protein